ncbi:hypothetical protein AAE478_000412 [Parahypoxylon ruwenzoriense]
MLVRLLQRPPLRSVAAVWRFTPTTAALLHGSARRQDENSPSSSPPDPPPPPSPRHDGHDDASQPPASSDGPPSLFERLFPDEAKQSRTQQSSGAPKSPSWTNQLFDGPPSEALRVRPGSGDEDIPPEDYAALSGVPLRAQSMLILSGASPSLQASDFLRLGRRGAHVEGWVGGIQRVVPARDPDTLRPLGHYFVLFDTPHAAVAYRDDVERLWRLGKTHVPGAHHGRRAENRTRIPMPLINVDRDRQGEEDIASAIRFFTLIPPSQRYHLELSTRHSPEQLSDLDLGGDSPDSSFYDRLAARVGSEHLVVVTVDGGRMSVDTLRQAIEEDGADRNLPWRVTDLERGILPFGKSVLKKYDRDDTRDTQNFRRSLWDQAGRTMGMSGREGGEQGDGTAGDDSDGSDGGDAAAAGEIDPEVDSDRMYRRYPRFIVPFTDNAEAQRFVRLWHRREFKLRMNFEGETKQVTWDETRILNTTMLW